MTLVQSLSQAQLFATPWTAALQASLSNTNSQSLLKLMSIELVMPSKHLIPCCPLLLLPSPFPSIRVFSSKSALCIRWPKYWSFSFSISPSNAYSGLISFRIDWFDLLSVQGTLKSLQKHQFFGTQLFLWSNSHINTWLLEKPSVQFSLIAQSCLTLRPRGRHYSRLPCPSPIPGTCSNSCPSGRWCHPTISSSVIPFSSGLHSSPASGSFPMSQFFASGGQSIGVFSFCISSSNEHSGLIPFRIDWFDLLAVQGTFKSLLQDHSSKASILWHSAFFMVQLSHPSKECLLISWLQSQFVVIQILPILFFFYLSF